MEQNSRNKKIVLGVMLVSVVILTLAWTFAYFVSNTQSTQEKLTVTTGTLALTFSDNNTGITKSQLQLGESTTKEFKIENTGTLPVTTNMLWNNLVNTYTEGSLTYEFKYSTNETGPWIAIPNANGDIPQSESASDKNLAENLTIPAKTTYYYQLTITFNDLPDVDQTPDKNAVLSSTFKLGDKIIEPVSIPKMVTAILNDKTVPYVKEGNPIFATAATDDETFESLYSMADDYGTSYYYRGAVENNYVKFAGKYWRIIRINGDGSLRMIYDGTVAHKNGEGSSTFTSTSIDGSRNSSDRFINNGSGVVFNPSYNDNAYVGWMFGGNDGVVSTSVSQAQTNTTNSDLKDIVDDWYETNLNVIYGKYIADVVYCNDRSISSTARQWWIKEELVDRGWKNTRTAYGGFNRFFKTDGAWNTTNPNPKFICEQENDMFTVNANTIHKKTTNGSLTYPVGLITADEAVAAGAIPGTTSQYYYLYKNSSYWYWLLSPWAMFDYNNAYVFTLRTNGALTSYGVNSASLGAVAPVISLKAEYASQLTGTGIASDPYTISGVA